jgi:hypothetical protein
MVMGLISVLSFALPVEVWIAYHSYRAYGGSASWSHGSRSVSGAHGGSASWSR